MGAAAPGGNLARQVQQLAHRGQAVRPGQGTRGRRVAVRPKPCRAASEQTLEKPGAEALPAGIRIHDELRIHRGDQGSRNLAQVHQFARAHAIVDQRLVGERR